LTRACRARFRGPDAKAYPFYDSGYKANVDIMRGWIADNAPNLHRSAARNARYNNQTTRCSRLS